MPLKSKPVVAQWYRHLNKGQEFQVTAVDEAERTVEIQHFDGDVEEIELDEWFAMDVEPIETPEDWTGPMDDVERDDLGYTETGMRGADWTRPLREGRAAPDEEEEKPRPGAEEEEPRGEEEQ
jgi:hypothetical protein